MCVICILPLRTRKPRESIGKRVLCAFDMMKYWHRLFEEEAPSSHVLIGEQIVDELFAVCVNVEFTTSV
jgi:hypothetical protein